MQLLGGDFRVCAQSGWSKVKTGCQLVGRERKGSSGESQVRGLLTDQLAFTFGCFTKNTLFIASLLK